MKDHMIESEVNPAQETEECTNHLRRIYSQCSRNTRTLRDEKNLKALTWVEKVGN
jgi:hypothetical protein